MPHDTPQNVVLIAFLQQDNLGVGYVGASLNEAGYRSFVVDFRLDRTEILEHVRRRAPLAVGFSIIFQYHIGAFAELVRFLRENGVDCHFTAGGHYPSLRWDELLARIPGLDSIVRFEGEHTIVRLADALRDGTDWRSIDGLAYRSGSAPVTNALAPLEPDLDRFPLPLRSAPRRFAFDRTFATLLASRGCVYDCVFCSIRKFYAAPPGPLKRYRRPDAVVDEMRRLHDEAGCSIFAFQDDDFPAGGARGRAWTGAFCDALRTAGLADRVLWKVSCRTDELEPDVVAQMRAHGLFLVYLGIESGTDRGLELMAKRSHVEDARRAVRLLEAERVAYDFGFMLFAPWSTPELVAGDLDFLDAICANGSSSATFCKMLPYAETEIERRLRDEGRLVGPLGEEDYAFDDPVVARTHDVLSDVFFGWVGEVDGVLNRSRWLAYEVALVERLADPRLGDDVHAAQAHGRSVIAAANRFLLSTAREVLGLAGEPISARVVDHLRQRVRDAHESILGEMWAASSEISGLASRNG